MDLLIHVSIPIWIVQLCNMQERMVAVMTRH